MELDRIGFEYSSETNQFKQFDYFFSTPIDGDKEQILTDLRSNFTKLKGLIESVIGKEYPITKKIGRISETCYKKGIEYSPKESEDRDEFQLIMENLTLKYDIDMWGYKVTKAGLCISHESTRQDELLQIYDAVMDLEDFTRSESVETEMKKVAILREGLDFIDDCFDKCS